MKGYWYTVINRQLRTYNLTGECVGVEYNLRFPFWDKLQLRFADGSYWIRRENLSRWKPKT